MPSGSLPSATKRTIKSTPFGVNTGISFSFVSSTYLTSIREVTIRSGLYVESIKIKVSSLIDTKESPTFGGRGGSGNVWEVPEGEDISRIIIRSSNKVNSLEFITDKDSRSPQYGGYEGEEKIYKVPNGYKVYGIHGYYGGYIYSIGFYLAVIDVNE